NPWIYIHPTVLSTVPRRSSDTNVKHDLSSFSRVRSHGISTFNRLTVFHYQRPKVKFIPFIFELLGLTRVIFGMRSYIYILIFYFTFRDLNLDITTGFIMHILRYFNYKFLDE